ncbi:MAG: hypothetical protein ABJF50_23260 [Paracoccaceae bacterium]
MKFITKNIHAYLDYPVALGLIAMPFILGLGAINPLALWLSVATGIAAFALTLLTDHHLGVVRILPYSLHLAVDFAVGLAFIAAPFVFGFAGFEAAYYWVLGATVLVVVGLHKGDEVAVSA